MTFMPDTRTRPFANRKQQNAAFSLGSLIGLWRQRRALAALDADALSDIGVTRRAAQKEAARPIWDVPSHWSR